VGVAVAAVVESVKDGALVVIAQRTEVLHEIRAAAEVEVRVGHRREVARQKVEPVDVRITEGIQACRRMLVFLQNVVRHHFGEAPSVLLRHVPHAHRLVAVDEFRRPCGRLHAVRCGNVELRLRLDAALGRHQNYAVGALGSEHGRRRRVLQYRYRVDFIGVQIRKVTLHAVHHDQRARTVPARNAADQDVALRFPGQTGGLHRQDARQLSGNRARDVRVARFGQALAADLSDRAHNALLLLDAVSYDYDFCQLLGIVHEIDFQIVPVANLYLYCLVTDVGDHKDAAI